METRETFAGLALWEKGLWYGLVVVSTAIFVWGVARLALKYRRGRGSFLLDQKGGRLRRVVKTTLDHSLIRRRDPLAGLGHLLVFYGFLVLFIGTSILAFQDNVARPLLDFDFWHGWFYLGYSLFLDVFGVALVGGLAVMAVKRGILKPFRLSYWRPDRAEGEYDRRPYVIGDWAFLGILFVLALTGFLLEAFRIAADDPDFEVWAPFGWLAGQGFIGLGLDGSTAESARLVQWWVHGIAALGFVSSIPFTKAVHMLTSPAGVGLRDDLAGKRLAPVPPDAKPEDVGYANLFDLSWKHLVDLDACTKCGKCHAACPATNSGYPLSPRDLVLDLREAGWHSAAGNPSVLGDPIRQETLWSCMQCMACVEICPVGIEHVPIINHMRRQVAEHLWFVGDYASFDPRNQQVTRALARVLHDAGVDFGILYDGERNAGCDVRRTGEEGLFVDLAEGNVETISACRFERLFTADPHSFHTLKNEYPEFGGSWTVLHHSQLLLELLESGRLHPRKGLGYRVTYHDPCHLGRYNGVYDPPRKVLRALGAELVDMPRCRDNSFCCGAGGGRILMSELRKEGVARPSEMRIDEAIALGGIDLFVVACPKDVTMYEDAVKTSGHQGEIEVRELSELVLESLAVEA